MKPLTSTTLERLWDDFDAREVLLRQVVADRMAESPPPTVPDHVVATYYFAFRTQTLAKAVQEISYHATSGIKNPPKGSLLEQCSARQAGVDPFDASGRIGLLHVAFPLKMLRHPDGHVTSCDLLHTLAGAVVFDMYEMQDARLIAIQIPDDVLASFPGPAYGPIGIRQKTGFALDQPAFGTILKPTAGITPDEVERLVEEVAGSPLLMFIKEDEDLYPDLDYSPVAERTRRAVAAIERVRGQRGGLGLVYSPHVTAAPHQIVDIVMAVLDAGASGVMFSETYAGGTVRMVREATRHLVNPPAIYGHNAGIGVKTRVHLARGHRPAGPARRDRFPPDGPRSSRTALHPSLRRRMARLGRRSHPADQRHQAHDDHQGRRTRPGQPDPQPPGRRIEGDRPEHPLSRRLGHQFDQGQERQDRPQDRPGRDASGDRGPSLGRACRHAASRAPYGTCSPGRAEEPLRSDRGAAAAVSG